MYNPFSLEGKSIFVSGASSGIGKAIAIECSKLGAQVVITGRDEERLTQTFELLEGDGHTKICADLGDLSSLEAFVAQLPQLDGVVHCAGMNNLLPFQFVKQEGLSKIMDINFTSPTLISSELVRKKKIAKGGSFVFVSSVCGPVCSFVTSSMYAATKGAVNGIVKGMAVDLATKGIRVNSVMPGMIESSILDAGVITEEQLAEDRKRYPLKRYGKPEEVAHLVIYLLSDAAAWVTGSNMLIDGGYTLL